MLDYFIERGAYILLSPSLVKMSNETLMTIKKLVQRKVRHIKEVQTTRKPAVKSVAPVGARDRNHDQDRDGARAWRSTRTRAKTPMAIAKMSRMLTMSYMKLLLAGMAGRVARRCLGGAGSHDRSVEIGAIPSGQW